MALFKTTIELKTFCPSINRNMQWDTFAPIVDQAERKYLIPLLGQQQFDALAIAYNTNTYTAEQTALLPYVQRPLAYYVYFEMMPQMIAMLSDMGVTEQSSDERTAQPSRQWVYQEQRNQAIQNADIYADQLLVFLEENAADYPLWKGSSSFTISKELFINTAADYDKHVPIGGSKRVWLALRPFLSQAETEYIQPAITAAVFADLKAKLLDIDTPLSTADKTLIVKIQLALAWLTICKALPFQMVKFSPEGLVQITRDTGITKQTTADRMQFQTAMSAAEVNGQSALRHLTWYIEEKKEDYPLYKSPDLYAQPMYNLPNNEGKSSVMV